MKAMYNDTVDDNYGEIQNINNESIILNSTPVTLATASKVESLTRCNISGNRREEKEVHVKQPNWERHSSGFASRMLKKMGYKGKGLGKSENGITEPIIIQNRHVLKATNNSNGKYEERRKLIYILSDSMLNQIVADRLSNEEYEVQVKCHGGCTIEHMYTHLPSVTLLKPEYIILHVGTNDCVNNTSDEVIKRLIELKTNIEKLLPSCTVCISLSTVRSDNVRANVVIRNLNTKLRKSEFMLLDNSNISEIHLGRKGLHFNNHGVRKMASNIISLIKRL